MRNRIIASLCTLLIWGPALAQEEEGGATDEGGELGGAEVAPEGDAVAVPGAATEAGTDTAPGEVHTVRSGDTLWDLSQTYLGSPWYWPKVWSYNPEIANPHWIYPGNRVRFFPSGEEGPSRVEVGTPPGDDGGDVEPSAMFEGDMGTVQAVGRIGYQPKNTTSLLLDGFMTAKELAEAGKIEGSFSEAQMLSYPETVYIRFKNKGAAKMGDEFVVFHTEKVVNHPDTQQPLGYMTKFLGKVKVVSISNELVTALITDTWDEIHRGDLIGPANENFHLKIAPRPNEKAMTAKIVEMLVPYQTMVGEHQLVLVDRGSADGVQVGNTFTVIRQSNEGGTNFMQPQYGQDKKWPEESIAACMVIDVKDRASTCLMTRSIREVLRGDIAVMKAPAAAAPTASR